MAYEEGSSEILSKTIRKVVILVMVCAGLAIIVGTGAGNLKSPAGQRTTSTTGAAQNTATQSGTQQTSSFEMAIPASDNGHFFVDTLVNGNPMRFMVDTGASSIALSRSQARDLDVSVGALEYDFTLDTAGGQVRAARIRLDEVELGDFRAKAVLAFVLESDLEHALLGMSFLGRLESYEVQQDQLVMRW
jgi:aspartyl protease family protein